MEIEPKTSSLESEHVSLRFFFQFFTHRYSWSNYGLHFKSQQVGYSYGIIIEAQ